MTYYSIWPYCACMLVLLGLVSLPVFAVADVPPQQIAQQTGRRISNLDGLRGFLAFGVFFHHAAVYHRFLQDGDWVDPPIFYLLTGEVGVAVFFMITGYLFWGKLLREQGRPDWLALYIGRVFRIGPVYLVAIGAMLLIVWYRTGGVLRVSPGQLALEVARWLPIGVLGNGPDVNGYGATSLLLFGVVWTLSSEWKFYASLLVLAVFARKGRLEVPFVAGGLLVCLIYSFVRPDHMVAAPSIRASFFLMGMLTATLERRRLTLRLNDAVLSIVALTLTILLFGFATSAYAAWPAIAMGLVFYMVVSGCSFFGLLSSRGARRLGDVSYSVYLLHGIVTTIVFSSAAVRLFALASPVQHWTTILGCSIVVLVVSMITFVGVERTGIQLGRRVLRVVQAGLVRQGLRPKVRVGGPQP